MKNNTKLVEGDLLYEIYHNGDIVSDSIWEFYKYHEHVPGQIFLKEFLKYEGEMPSFSQEYFRKLTQLELEIINSPLYKVMNEK
jgi:hypothetical protein